MIGGAHLIHTIINHPKLRYVYLNQFNDDYQCNIFIKPLLEYNFNIIEKNVDNFIMYKLENNLFIDEKIFRFVKKYF